MSEILAVCVPQVFYVASFLYTVNYTWHLYRDLKVKYNQSLNRMPPTVSRTDIQQPLGTETYLGGSGGVWEAHTRQQTLPQGL